MDLSDSLSRGLSYHWEALAERADGLRNIRVFPPAGVGIAFVDRLPCDGRSGQQGHDEKGEELDLETHVGSISAAGRVVRVVREGQGRETSMFYTYLAIAWLMMLLGELCHC